MRPVAVSVAVIRFGRLRSLCANGAVTRAFAGAPGEIRTPNLLIRSQMLYPLSYGCSPRGSKARSVESV